MKTILLLLALIMVVVFTSYAQTAGRPQLDQATFETIFYGLYPDLAEHKDLVGSAMVSIVGEGFRATSFCGALSAIATRARTNLQSSGQSQSQLDADSFKAREDASRAEAQRLFPQVAEQNTPLERRVRSERDVLARIYPNYFKNPNWPLMLTQSCANMMALETQEKVAQQRAQAAQSQVTAEQAKQTIELLQMLQNLDKGQTGQTGQRPTQYNGRPLPRNWIDPKQADTNFFLQQLQDQLNR